MDNKMKKMTIELIKNIIIEQNKLLLKEVAKEADVDEKELIEKYIKPEYYLPIIIKKI